MVEGSEKGGEVVEVDITVDADRDADSSNNHSVGVKMEHSEPLDPVTDTNTNTEAAPPLDGVIPPATRSPYSSTPTKGFGLKKWRRIRRKDRVTPETETELEIETEKDMDRQKEKDSDSESTGRMLKRGSSNILNENNASPTLPTTATVATTTTPTAFVLPFPVTTNYSNGLADLDSNPNATFNSDNSEDNHSHSHSQRSNSKSSTAASVPKHAKHRVKNTGAKNMNQRIQSGKSQPQPDPSKKPRGGNGSVFFELDKESSPLSSMESDSRSSNSVLFRGLSDQVPTPNPLSFDEEDDEEDACHPLPPSPPCEQQPAEQSPVSPTRNKSLSPDSSDQLSSSANQVKSKDHQLPTDRDPLVDSILSLQSAQLALQKEVQKFEEIGRGIYSLCDDSEKTSGDPGYKTDRGSDGWNEFTQAYLIKYQRQLNEAEGSLREKEERIVELETTIRSMESTQDHVRRAMEQQYKRCIDMEAELQDLFKQKLEADIQSVVMTICTKDLMVKDQIKFSMEQTSVYSNQANSTRMGVDVENEAIRTQGMIQNPDTLDTNTSVVGDEELLKMQRGVVKFTKCLIIQLVLLVLVFALFVLQLVPKSAVVIPT